MIRQLHRLKDEYLGEKEIEKGEPRLPSVFTSERFLTGNRGDFPFGGHRLSSLYRKAETAASHLSNGYFLPSFSQNADDSRTLIVTDQQVSVYYVEATCGSKNVVLLNIVSENTVPVTVTWSMWDNGKTKSLEVQPGQTVKLAVRYRSRGTTEWSYKPADGVATLKDFRVELETLSARILYIS